MPVKDISSRSVGRFLAMLQYRAIYSACLRGVNSIRQPQGVIHLCAFTFTLMNFLMFVRLCREKSLISLFQLVIKIREQIIEFAVNKK